MKAKRFLVLLVALLTLSFNSYSQNSWGKVVGAGVQALFNIKKAKKAQRQHSVPNQANNYSYNGNEEPVSEKEDGENVIPSGKTMNVGVNQASNIADKSASQPSADDVTIVVTGEGVNNEEATKVALRSAISQVYGVFVSANTTLLNDNLVADEIITITVTTQSFSKMKIALTMGIAHSDC